jgi:tricorn protease
LFLRSGPYYDGRSSSVKPSVIAYDIKERDTKTVVEDVAAWLATADGKHVLAQLNSKEFKYVDVGKSDEGKSVSLAGLMTSSVPAEEWREMFAEVWRRYRDYFYVQNMHGYDWQKLRAKYEPQLAFVAHRADLNYVIAEMIAELTVQHAYIEGGDMGLPSRPSVALPGARFELDAASGRYRIAKIFAGQNEEERYRSPLTEVGVGAKVGDYLLAVNGRELDAGTDPYELLQAPPELPMEWRVSTDPAGRLARTIRFQPLQSETALLYLEWTANNRARVERMSDGRLGYIHIPDMGADGLREFIKWWYPQVRKQGLVVDVRDNGGGNVSELLISRLAATLHGTRYVRNQSLVGTYPGTVQNGPKVALINEDTASDGDIFAYQFREQKIGALIGKRTWGGVIGISPRNVLADGAVTTQPEFSFWFVDVGWKVENYGTDPDIDIDIAPQDYARGYDPQMEKALEVVLDLLEKNPPIKPAFDERPNLAAPPLKRE